MAMRLTELMVTAGLDPATVRDDADVTDVTADSRRCRAGSCFVAIRGTEADGHRYIGAAVAAGAVAVICEDPAAAPAGCAWATVKDGRAAVARLAQAIRGWPARRLACIGITGTNGKTTVAHLVRAILADAGHSPALLGTIAYETGDRALPAATTTPDPVTLAGLMAEMVAAGRTHLVMEASSHALDQRRTEGIDFHVAVFTNLSGDHLDYHHTMGEYRAAKLRLFEALGPGATAAINRDDEAGEALARATPAHVRWYGLSSAADLWARINVIDSTGTDFTLVSAGGETPAHTPLIGRHNVMNCLAAASAADALGVTMPAVAESLRRIECIPGRLQRVPSDAPFDVFVDYAHTDDALANVLGALRPVTRGRVIVVFGCGGDRDRTKRPRMAHVAEHMADQVVVTSDNPRTERPEEIIEEICSGFSPAGFDRASVEPDRRAAIARGVGQARAGDVVLIAGKGHETYQVFGTERIHFDDVEVASEALAALRERS